MIENKVEESAFSRTEKLIGKEAVDLLKSKKIAIFGIGGVGSYVLEALVRVGVGAFILVDKDTVSESNLNRQLIALNSTVGKLKTDVAKNRILDINPSVVVKTFPVFYNTETTSQFDSELATCDYIIDAIDTVSAKILLIEKAKDFEIPIISCMGTGNKLNPSLFQIADISKTSVCPLAKVMRLELKKRNIRNVKVLFSTETPAKHRPPASISFVPSVAGLLIASEVVKDFCGYSC